jgi:lysophospholipase L1-like esterase
VSRETSRWYLEMYGEPNAQGWRRTQGLIRQMQRRTQERGGRFLLAVWPLLVGLDGDPPLASVHATIRAFCADAGLPHHDLLDTLRGRGTDSLWVHPGDMHPNAKAHRLVAESLAPVVRNLARKDE